jgi:glycerophosphoryl diester phosphodiesterase
MLDYRLYLTNYLYGGIIMITNFAHRGASAYYPENTMLAFEKAIEMGCTGIETDVQLSKDGVLVLIHDEYLNRTTNGTGLVKDYTLSELQSFDAGSFKNKSFSQCRIPTAEDLILLVKDKDIIINFEIKSGMIIYEGIEQKLIDLINSHNLQHKVILSSFNHYSMVKCKEISAEIKTGLLYMEGLYHPEKYCSYVGADALHPFYPAADKTIVESAHHLGLQINPFTIDDEKIMKHMIALGVDGIITNYPDKLNKIIGG